MSSSTHGIAIAMIFLCCSTHGRWLETSAGPLREYLGSEAVGTIPKARPPDAKRAPNALALVLLSLAPAAGFHTGSFGLRFISMNPPAASVPAVSQRIRSTDIRSVEEPVVQPSRRALLLAALAAGSIVRPLRAAVVDLEGPDESLEDSLVQRLKANGIANNLPGSASDQSVDGLITDLERRGGSILQLAEGPGSFETPWIGAWEVLYVGGKSLTSPMTIQTSLKDGSGVRFKLVSARQFVNGVKNATAEMFGIPGDDGISTEYIYAPEEKGPRRILLARTGSLIKLPDFAYRFDFQKPTATLEYQQPSFSEFDYQLPQAIPGGDDLEYFVLNSTTLPANSVKVTPAGAFPGKITYLSNRLWITRGSDDGVLMVLRRCNSMALVQPAMKDKVFATCAETGFGNWVNFCRTRQLF